MHNHIPPLLIHTSINLVFPEESDFVPQNKDDKTDTVGIALGVTFAILFVAGMVIGGVIVHRRRASGKNIQPKFLRHFIAKI